MHEKWKKSRPDFYPVKDQAKTGIIEGYSNDTKGFRVLCQFVILPVKLGTSLKNNN
jgi:hypothetical protein